MTEILATGREDRRKAGVRRQKKHNLRTDMTPMVDLGFLLITFFVFTAEISKPATLKLYVPKQEGPPTKLAMSNALTVLLGDHDKVYYYHGDWKDAFAANQVFTTNLSVTDGLGKVVRDKQKWLDIHNLKEKRNGLMFLIKPAKGASYKMVIDALDEVLINKVSKYTILPLTPEETAWMEKQK